VTTQSDTFQRTPFRVHTHLEGGHLYVLLVGELDLEYAKTLETGVLEPGVLDRSGVTRVTIDMGDLVFINTAGARALLSLRSAHQRLGRDVRITNASSLARNIPALVGSELTG
jgi:anti-anti-sigma factor